MDIRSYFGNRSSTLKTGKAKEATSRSTRTEKLIGGGGKKGKPQRNQALLDESDDDGDFANIRKKSKMGKKRKVVSQLSTDSESGNESKRKKSNTIARPSVSKPLEKKTHQKEKQTKGQPVDVDAFFGDKPIQRTSKSIYAEKKKNDIVMSDKEVVTPSNKKRKTYFDDDIEGTSVLEEVDTLKVTSSRKSSVKDAKIDSSATVDKRAKKIVRESKTTPTATSTKSAQKDNVEINKAGEKSTTDKTAYRDFMARDGPRALGSRDIPEGQENCMAGLVFVFTGVLDTIEREKASEIVQRYGGKVTVSGSISKKTDYVIAGRDPGLSKLEKAKKLGTKQLNEDEFYNLIATLPAKKIDTKKSDSDKVAKGDTKATPIKKNTSKNKADTVFVDRISSLKSPTIKVEDVAKTQSQVDSTSQTHADAVDLMWVDKYKPTSTKMIVGQQGGNSCVKKLLKWLTMWQENNTSATNRNKLSKELGFAFKAALLSGPPGIGKTTSATLACQECNYDILELNASDARSKKSLDAVISEALDNKSIAGFVGKGPNSNRLAVIMDEVDGMAGNEDRGGVQELINVIKKAKIPILCVCNDRNHPKIRSLANHCFDIRFQRPRAEQICGALMSISFKEGVKIAPQTVQQIVAASHQDIRQSIHNLNLWCANSKNTGCTAIIQKKDIKLGPFDAIRKVFDVGSGTSTINYNEKAGLFFCDYSLMPLFVQENYPLVSPVQANNNHQKTLDLLSKAANSISSGDLATRILRSTNQWSLLPSVAAFASVIPGAEMRGYFGGRIEFPTWLGKNSRQGKYDRMLQELTLHMRIRCSANHIQLGMEYIPELRYFLSSPFITKENDGIDDVIDVMNSYYLTREDWDNIMDVGLYPGQLDPITKLNSKVKAAFSRSYNKKPHLMPYADHGKPKRGRVETANEDIEENHNGDTPDENVEEESTPEMDSMIKAKKLSATQRRSKATESSAKQGKSSKKRK